MNAVTSAPLDLIVANSDGVDIRFAGIDLDTAPVHVSDGAGDPSIHLHLSGVRCSETQRRDNQFLQDRQAWSDRRKARSLERSDEDPPQMPGVAVFDQIGIQLTDDLGTEYRRAGGKVAGDGTEWDALWVYVPSPPQNARTLRIEFSVDGHSTRKHCELSLD